MIKMLSTLVEQHKMYHPGRRTVCACCGGFDSYGLRVRGRTGTGNSLEVIVMKGVCQML